MALLCIILCVAFITPCMAQEGEPEVFYLEIVSLSAGSWSGTPIEGFLYSNLEEALSAPSLVLGQPYIYKIERIKLQKKLVRRDCQELDPSRGKWVPTK